MKQLWADFKKFITRGNVVDMAVGVAVASAFTAIVTAFTKGFITPLLALLTNNSDLTEMKWVIRPEEIQMVDGVETVVTAEVALLWGAFVQKIIDFFIIAIVLFAVMRIAGAIAARSAKLREQMVNALTHSDERAAEEAAAAAEAEAQKAAEEAAAAEAARLAEEERARAEAEKAAATEARLEREEALLTEIRDLLRARNG